MLAAVIIIYVFLIFPTFVSINAFFSKKTGKLYFGIFIFGIIKILSGYAQTCDDGYVIHLSDKKAVFTPYKSLFEIKNTVAPLKDYHISKIDWFIELGSDNSVMAPLAAAYILNFINYFARGFIFSNRPYLKINNGISVYEEKDMLNFYIKTVVILNLLMIIISLIKIFMEKILNVFRQRKQDQ